MIVVKQQKNRLGKCLFENRTVAVGGYTPPGLKFTNDKVKWLPMSSDNHRYKYYSFGFIIQSSARIKNYWRIYTNKAKVCAHLIYETGQVYRILQRPWLWPHNYQTPACLYKLTFGILADVMWCWFHITHIDLIKPKASYPISKSALRSYPLLGC